jgi:hypothetical protein
MVPPIWAPLPLRCACFFVVAAVGCLWHIFSMFMSLLIPVSYTANPSITRPLAPPSLLASFTYPPLPIGFRLAHALYIDIVSLVFFVSSSCNIRIYLFVLPAPTNILYDLFLVQSPSLTPSLPPLPPFPLPSLPTHSLTRHCHRHRRASHQTRHKLPIHIIHGLPSTHILPK